MRRRRGRDSLTRKAVLQLLPASLLLLLVLVASMVQGQQSAAQGPTTLGVDPQTAGNTATSIASIQECTAVNVGDTFEVDIYIADVDELRAFELYFGFDGAVIEVVNHDLRQFLGSSLYTLKDPVPNSSGRHFLAAATKGVDRTGSGVLVRVTLTANAAGRSPATILPIFVWPQLTGAHSQPIGDVDGDKVFDGPIHQAQIAVGEPCPQPTPTPPSASPTPPRSETPPPGTPAPTPASPGPDATPPPSGDNEPAPGDALVLSLDGAIPPPLPGLTDSVIFTAGAGPSEPDATAEPATTPVALAEGSTPGAAGSTPAAGGSSSPSGGGSGGPPLWLLVSLGLLAVGAGAGGLLVVKSARRSHGAR